MGIKTQQVTAKDSIEIQLNGSAGIPSEELDTARTLVELSIQYKKIPGTNKIKDWTLVAVSTGNLVYEREKILNAITQIFRLEEEECTPTDNNLCQILMLLEEDKPAQELSKCLSSI